MPVLPSAPATGTPPVMLPGDAAQEASLRAIHLPAEVNWFPPAPGWWGVLVLLLVLVAAGAWVWRRYRRQAFRREALLLLAGLQQRNDLSPLQQLDEISALLKRVAITVHGREAVAGFSGERWLRFLDESGQTTGFSNGPGRCLGASRFQPNAAIDTASLFPLCRDWIQKQPC